MDSLIELAMYVGRLEQRVKALEERDEMTKYTVSPVFGDTESSTENGEKTSDKLLQDGIDNIMAYQWPPAKAGE